MGALSDRGSVAAIGPAGENGVLFSNIMMGEGNAVGRGGLGAVLGTKNLKAITVDGDLRTPVANRERFDRARADVMRLFRASPVIFGELGISEYGTPALVDLMRQRRMAPTENFRRTVFEDSSAYSGPGDPRGVRREEGRLLRLPDPMQEERRQTGAACRSTRRSPTSAP